MSSLRVMLGGWVGWVERDLINKMFQMIVDSLSTLESNITTPKPTATFPNLLTSSYPPSHQV